MNEINRPEQKTVAPEQRISAAELRFQRNDSSGIADRFDNMNTSAENNRYPTAFEQSKSDLSKQECEQTKRIKALKNESPFITQATLQEQESEKTLFGKDELVVRDTKYLDLEGNIDWKMAPNGGRVKGTIKENQILESGTMIDRYGSHWGRYTSPQNTPFEERSLPYKENPNAYHKYEVVKPIDGVTTSKIAPAFDQKGGGTQYELPRNVRSLVKDGYLKEVT